MRLTPEALATGIVVRRLWRGAAPFWWAVYRIDTAIQIYVSSDRFRSMHLAYRAGQARLAEFLPKRLMPPGIMEHRECQSCWIGGYPV
jgi:hypothetical protein